MMARGGTRHYEWTPEEDEILRKYADGEASVPAIKQAFLEETGDERSITTIRKRMCALGLPMRGKGAKKLDIPNRKKKTAKITDLKKGKTYYFRVRAYVTIDGKKVYADWSEKEALKIQK